MGVLVLISAYLLGSLPMGYIFLKVFKRQDITNIGSGRTGGTNAMRAGGIWLGLLTAMSDLGKGYLAVYIARWLVPDVVWIHILSGVMSVLGHNWSIWLYVYTRKFNAGAGTGPNIGAAMAFWPGVIFLAAPLVLFLVMIVGYASVASLSTAFLVVIVFLIRSFTLGTPKEYVFYGLFTMILVTCALRPNIIRLIQGNERRVGILIKIKSHNQSSTYP